MMSRQNADISVNIDNIQKRISNLERIDKNNDGIISKSELCEWMEEQKRELRSFKQQLEDESTQLLVARMADANKQIECLKAENAGLRERLADCDAAVVVPIKRCTDPVPSISSEKIDQIVDEMLKDEQTNIRYLPDWVEKKIYTNIIRLSINLLSNATENTKVSVWGHEITLGIKPTDGADE